METGKILWVLFLVGIFAGGALAGEITLITDTNNPDPNEEVTIYVHTDTPLFAMGTGIYVIGDANITGGMCEADCNQYGWDNGWNSDPYIDPNGYIYLGGVRWASDANGVISYFKFRYNSGQVSVYLDQEWSCAFSWDGNSCPEVPFSSDILLFGQPDSNDFNEMDFFSQDEIIVGEEIQMDSLSSYDVTLTGVHKYTSPISYSNQTILADDSAYLVYDCNFTLVNCVMDVNGSVEFNRNITLTNSQIRVKGNLKCKPGIEINETGASSIRATGDDECAGKITLDGDLDNTIIVVSDNVSVDSEFIIIDANSSSNSSLKCIDFYGGWTNIQINNKRLNKPISNCCFFGAENAIWQDGVTELTTINFSLFSQNYISIYAGIDGISRTVRYPLIDNVVIDGIPGENLVTFGIVLEGGQSTSYFDYFEITNSIIANCYCGWYFDADNVYPPNMLNLAYYGNDYDDNYGHPSFVRNPMYLTQTPFVSYGGWPYFTNPASPVADVNFGYNIEQDAPEQMLTSVYSDSTPRTNIGLGFGLALPSGYVSHVPNLIQGDFDESGLVNNRDFYVFAADWRSIRGTNPIHYPDVNGYSVADFDKAGVVNNFDLAVFATNWLSDDGIELIIDSNDTLITATCQQIPGLYIKYYVFFLDGKFIGLRDPNEIANIIVEKMKYPQGLHYLNAVAVTTNGSQFYTESQEVLFNPPLSNLSFDESFDPAKKFAISGKVNAGYAATISIKNLDNQILWSSTYTTNFNTKLDSSIFSSEFEFEVSYSYEENTLEMLDSGSLMMSSSASSSSGSSSVVGLDGPPDNRTTGLILCMMEDGWKDGSNWTDTGTCRFAHKMMLDNGVWPMTLRGFGGYNRVTRGIINQVFRKYPNIKYCHIYAHGNYETDKAWPFTGDARRTRLLFNDGEWVAFNSHTWLDRDQAVPAGYEYLSDRYENAHYLNQIPFATGQLKILVIESCYALRNIVTIDGAGLCHYQNGQYDWEINNHRNYSYDYGYPFSDICAGLNMTGNQSFALGGGEVIIKGPYTYYSKFFNNFWQGLADGKTALNAWDWAYWHSDLTVEVQYKHRWRGAGTGVTLSN
ncbi:MAG: hypothetical protein ABFD79_16520 [Phycisphaerales bacterium]